MEFEELGERISSFFVGNKHERDIKKLQPRVVRINALEPEIQRLSDDELRAKTDEFRAQVAERMKDVPTDTREYIHQLQDALDEVLEPAFAVVREVGRRKLSMRHFDVQLIGGMVLHEGKIAALKTGEGKTLVATLPVYLNALPGNGVHVVTVNDYLARRHAEGGPHHRPEVRPVVRVPGGARGHHPDPLDPQLGAQRGVVDQREPHPLDRLRGEPDCPGHR